MADKIQCSGDKKAKQKVEAITWQKNILRADLLEYKKNKEAVNLKQVSYNMKYSSNIAGVVFHDKEVADNLRIAVENLRAGTKKFDEDMEALQHNFLFRGFFRKRAKRVQANNLSRAN